MSVLVPPAPPPAAPAVDPTVPEYWWLFSRASIRASLKDFFILLRAIIVFAVLLLPDPVIPTTATTCRYSSTTVGSALFSTSACAAMLHLRSSPVRRVRRSFFVSPGCGPALKPPVNGAGSAFVVLEEESAPRSASPAVGATP